MNEEQYLSLCDACDGALLARESAVERLAISWLHVLNEHPTNLERYAGVLSGRPSQAFIGLKSTLLTLSQLAGRFRSSESVYASRPLPSRCDVIFVSHLLNVSQAGAQDDFYFGTTPEQLSELGLSSVVVLRNHVAMQPQEAVSKWTQDQSPRVLFSNSLAWRGEMALRRRLRAEAARLRAEARHATEPLCRRVLGFASQHAISYATQSTLRFYQQMLWLSETLRPKAIVVTYEGHAWERLAFAAVRRAVPGARCIGYHHAILFPRQHAVKRMLGRQFEPTTVLTAGDITREVLGIAKGMAHVKVTTAGTHRRDEPAARLSEKLSSGHPVACLALPDGTLAECLTIFDFVIECAALAPSVRFYLRLHPVMPFATVAAADPSLNKLPSNVELSTRTIGEDFERCRWAIYRGSGAAIRAVAAGLRPFYVARPDELSIDPLYNLHDWRRVVRAPTQFVAQIKSDCETDVSRLEAEFAAARTFCEKYFMPANLDSFYNEIVDRQEANA